MSAAQWYIQTDGEPLGPYGADDIRTLLKNATITADTAACREGADAWQSLRSFPDFAPAAEVKITGVAIPFWDLVRLLVKIAIASIPAAVIVTVAYFLIGMLVMTGTGAFVAIVAKMFTR